MNLQDSKVLGKCTSQQECIPVGCVPPAAVAVGGGVLGWPVPPQLPPWVWAWTRSPSTSPLGVDLDQISLNFPLVVDLDQIPSTSPLVVGLDQIPLKFPLGVGLETPPDQAPPWTRHPPGAGTPPEQAPPFGQTDTCKNITFAKYVCGR